MKVTSDYKQINNKCVSSVELIFRSRENLQLFYQHFYADMWRKVALVCWYVTQGCTCMHTFSFTMQAYVRGFKMMTLLNCH